MKLMTIIRDIKSIFRNNNLNYKWRLSYDYIKINLKKNKFLSYCKSDNYNASIVNYKINYLNYPDFIYIFREIFIRFEYYFKANVTNPFIIDCGSNIGLSVLFFKMLYPDCRIIAFEPNNDTFRVLSDNVNNNNLADIKLINKALNSVKGIKKFYFKSDQPGHGRSSLIERDFLSRSIEVDSVLLSDYIEQKVDFLKMDIEGAEISVIKELAKNKKLELINEMIIEYHHHIQTGKDYLSQILLTLERNGFGYQINAFSQGYFSKRLFQDIVI